jgi:peptidoglycan/xylan/chitin deacetylase (PgdA/CDA1 family)
MKKIILSFDIEPDLHSGNYLGITRGIKEIKKILDKNKIKATFFVTCDCILKYPKIFLDLKKDGHEISLHGYNHDRFDELSLKRKEDSIKKSISCFKKILKHSPLGFRAPQHSIDEDTLKLLEKYGFKYDSSKTPLNLFQFIFFPKKFKLNFQNFFSKPQGYNIGKLKELPPTSLFIPFVSLTIRVLPRTLQQLYLQFLLFFFKEIIFYAHSWDFISLPESKLDRNYSHKKLISNLEYIISSLRGKVLFLKTEELIP